MADPTVAHVSIDNRSVLFHLRYNVHLVISAFFLALCFFNFGYDGSVVGGVIAMPTFIADFSNASKAVLPAQDTSIITSVPIVGSIIGTMVAGWTGDILGRKKSLWIAALVNAIGSAIQTAAINVAMMTAGRAVANIGGFMFLSLAGAFQSELAPVPIRGAMVALSIISINCASVLTSGISWGTHDDPTELSYRLPLGIQCIWPIIIALGLFLIVDSPTQFLIKGDDASAKASLRKVRQGYSEHEIEAEMATLKHQASLREAESETSWMDLFRGTNRRRTLLAISIGNFQQLSGVAFATNYATIFLAQIGTADPFLLVLALNILSLGGSVVGLFLVEWLGRRKLALSTFTALLIIDAVIGGLGFADASNPTVTKTIAAFCLMFGFFFAAGFGPLTYVVSAEMPTARLRNKTASFTFTTIALFNLAAVSVLPYIVNADEANLGAKTYVIFAGWMLGCIIVTYLYLPETKGRAPAELDEMFNAGVPARQFKGYVCAVDPAHETEMELKKNDCEVDHEEKLESA